MGLKLNIIIVTALLFLSVLSSGYRDLADQFQLSVENSGICLDDKDTNMEEDEFSSFEISHINAFFIPQATLFTSYTAQTSILNFDIWNPPE
ncbi:MAG: hypothetical protein Q8933_19525 [Bacteroidota bacterium]|nr:hypothetical protein [Bacteroidota bacterium]MDP4196585.1 hypothetical protein [Bacteroidota bacterium]